MSFPISTWKIKESINLEDIVTIQEGSILEEIGPYHLVVEDQCKRVTSHDNAYTLVLFRAVTGIQRVFVPIALPNQDYPALAIATDEDVRFGIFQYAMNQVFGRTNVDSDFLEIFRVLVPVVCENEINGQIIAGTAMGFTQKI